MEIRPVIGSKTGKKMVVSTVYGESSGVLVQLLSVDGLSVSNAIMTKLKQASTIYTRTPIYFRNCLYKKCKIIYFGRK